MSILIIDPEEYCRDALTAQLTKLGHSSVYQARRESEAIALLSGQIKRIRFVIAAHELWDTGAPTQVTGWERLMMTEPRLDASPLLLISSGLSGRAERGFLAAHPRIDHHLAKPFRTLALSEAMARTQFRRKASHGTLLFYAAPDAPVPAWDALEGALKRRSAQFPWSRLVRVSSPAELMRALSENRVGALLIDAASASASLERRGGKADWLTLFATSPLGSLIPRVCLSRSPAIPAVMRTRCQLFFDSASSDEGCETLLTELARYAYACGWPVRSSLDQARAAFHAGQTSQARRYVERMLRSHPRNAEALSMLGDVLNLSGDPDGAILSYRSALAANPFLPGPYVRLLELVDSSESGEILRLARLFCPRYPKFREETRGGIPAGSFRTPEARAR